MKNKLINKNYDLKFTIDNVQLTIKDEIAKLFLKIIFVEKP